MTTQLRMPENVAAYIKEKSRELGISQNAFTLILLNLGKKAYERFESQDTIKEQEAY